MGWVRGGVCLGWVRVDLVWCRAGAGMWSPMVRWGGGCGGIVMLRVRLGWGGVGVGCVWFGVSWVCVGWLTLSVQHGRL